MIQEWRRCERLLALEARLPAVLGGKDRVADADEGLDFADLCRIKRRYAAAAGFFADALAARPRLADDQRTRVRNHAPLVAILAGTGRGEDADKLSEAERARWRKQAREWMRADLAAWAEGRDGGPGMDREAVTRTLTHWWGRDHDLAGMAATRPGQGAAAGRASGFVRQVAGATSTRCSTAAWKRPW